MMVEYLHLRQTNVVVVVMHNPDHPVTCARLHSLTFTYIIASLREGNLLNIEMSDWHDYSFIAFTSIPQMKDPLLWD